ncbi:hypothetical protein [Nocardioides massiliensis]|uniref:Acyl esterase n=1 Tax=Nocardioides massiliensis TaxID=1325935 RepID=A0ABT9NKV6_9ACTN|nr:hypothetical protein [Nocardioides massiliensis]MDP9821044.1 putative acyl esterase [Nocardioides massiliensis]
MAKFHINATGEPGPCTATVRGCPYGGEDKHFATEEAAYDAIDARENRVRYFEQDWYRNNSALSTGSDLTASLDTWMSSEVENSDLNEQEESDLAQRLVESGPEGDWEEVTDTYLRDARG